MAVAPTGAPTTTDGQWLDEYAELFCFVHKSVFSTRQRAVYRVVGLALQLAGA
jgi:hypothetical protein